MSPMIRGTITEHNKNNGSEMDDEEEASSNDQIPEEEEVFENEIVRCLQDQFDSE